MRIGRGSANSGVSARVYLLLAAFIGVLLWSRWLDVKGRAIRARVRTVPVVTALLPASARPAVAEGMEASAVPDTGWGRDPFERRVAEDGEEERSTTPRPAGPIAVQPPALSLEGIMAGPRGRTAIINGEVYREGDHVGSCEVLQIGRDKVLLRDHGSVRTLGLAGSP